MLNSSIRNIVQAIGDNKLEIKGTIVKPKIARGRHEYNGSQRSTNNCEQLESQASNDNGESNRNFNGIISQTEILTIGAKEIIESKMNVLYRIIAVDGDR